MTHQQMQLNTISEAERLAHARAFLEQRGYVIVTERHWNHLIRRQPITDEAALQRAVEAARRRAFV